MPIGDVNFTVLHMFTTTREAIMGIGVGITSEFQPVKSNSQKTEPANSEDGL